MKKKLVAVLSAVVVGITVGYLFALGLLVGFLASKYVLIVQYPKLLPFIASLWQASPNSYTTNQSSIRESISGSPKVLSHK